MKNDKNSTQKNASQTDNTPAPTVAPAVIPQHNPFAAATRFDNTNMGSVSVEEQRAIAEAQGKLLIAQKFPRNEAAAFDSIMLACSRETFADAALYMYPRGDANIEGGSIRLAEEVARCWGNIEFGIRELSQKEGISEMQAYAIDLQRNVTSLKNFVVKHERSTRSGNYKLSDPRDIYELTANMGGRRLRAVIFAILPSDLIQAAVDRVKLTISGNAATLKDRVGKMVPAFEKYGVTKAMIEARIEKKIAEITSEDFISLKAIFTSLHDGMTKPADFFGALAGGNSPAEGGARGGLNAQIQNKASNTKQDKAKGIAPETSTVATPGDENLV